MTAAPRAARLSALVALVLAAAWVFWPIGLGGGTTYVATHGVSMEPGFHTGDMAVLRPAGSYSVGDVVAYSSTSLNTVVMHRIVDGDASGFVTQGDNNDWLDEDRPTQDEILGRLFLRIPKGGTAIDTLRSPAALGGIAAAALSAFGAARRPRTRADRRAGRRGTARRAPSFAMPTRARARQVALGSGAVALVALGGSGVLFALPSTQTDTRTLQVVQRGEFSYTGAAVPGTTYPAGVIETGDTVWTKLAEQVTVSFRNTVTGPDLTEVRGAMRLDVSLTAADGWTAPITSGPEAPLDGGTSTASVTIDPSAAASLLSRHNAEIGASGGGATLTVTPVAVTIGLVEGWSFTAGPPAAMTFALDALALKPLGELDQVLAPSSETAVAVEEVVPRSLPVLSGSVPIDAARIAAIGVLALALLTFGAAAWIGRVDREDVADRFLVRHADRILPVAAFSPGPMVFDVADAESLHRVAERFDTVVLHHAAEDEDVFVVREADATYRFVVPGAVGRHRGKPPVPAPAHSPETEPVDATRPLPRFDPAPPDQTSPLELITASTHGRHRDRAA